MKFEATINVLGAKASKGEMEGTPYDHTTIYASTSLDDSKANAKGEAGTEYRFGTAAEFDKIKHNSFPFIAQCQFEIVTTGKVAKTVMLGMTPVKAVVQRPAA